MASARAQPSRGGTEGWYAPSTAHVKSHRIEQRLPVRMSLAKQRQLLARELLRQGVDAKAFAISVKKGLERGRAPSWRLWLEVFGFLPDGRQRNLSAALVQEIMAIIKPYVHPSKLPEVAKQLAKMASRKCVKVGNHSP
jgi:hypothetical protein